MLSFLESGSPILISRSCKLMQFYPSLRSSPGAELGVEPVTLSRCAVLGLSFRNLQRCESEISLISTTSVGHAFLSTSLSWTIRFIYVQRQVYEVILHLPQKSCNQAVLMYLKWRQLVSIYVLQVVSTNWNIAYIASSGLDVSLHIRQSNASKVRHKSIS